MHDHSLLRDLIQQMMNLQDILLTDPLIIRRIFEQHGDNSMVNQVALVNPRDALRNHTFHAKIHRVDRRVLSRRPLPVVLAADDDASSHHLRALRKLRIIAVIAELRHHRNIRAHTGELRAGRCDIIGRYIIARFQADRHVKFLLRHFRHGQRADIRAAHDLYLRRLFLRKRRNQHVVILIVHLWLTDAGKFRHIRSQDVFCGSKGSHNGGSRRALRTYQINLRVRISCAPLKVSI